tara:strand:+ start:437 stop:631 length:195 start_codon:yes stop_codon:yes gene_type:complete
MKDRYSDGEVSKELLRKNKNNNRKINQRVSQAASYDKSNKDSEEPEQWDDYEDLSFEKFRNGKR